MNSVGSTLQIGGLTASNHWLEYQLTAPEAGSSEPGRRKLTAADYEAATASALAAATARANAQSAATAPATSPSASQQQQQEQQERQQSAQRQQLLDNLFAQLRQPATAQAAADR